MAFLSPLKALMSRTSFVDATPAIQILDAASVNWLAALLFASVVLTVPQAAGAQANEDQGGTIDGVWATQGFGSRVQIGPCGRDDGGICGEIVWLWEPTDKNGHAVLDGNNPDEALTRRPLVGVKILEGFAYDGDRDEWRGGRIYNPEDGRNYHATIRRRDASTLEVKGCAARIFCQTQIWRLASSVCPSDGDMKESDNAQ